MNHIPCDEQSSQIRFTLFLLWLSYAAIPCLALANHCSSVRSGVEMKSKLRVPDGITGLDVPLPLSGTTCRRSHLLQRPRRQEHTRCFSLELAQTHTLLSSSSFSPRKQPEYQMYGKHTGRQEEEGGEVTISVMKSCESSFFLLLNVKTGMRSLIFFLSLSPFLFCTFPKLSNFGKVRVAKFHCCLFPLHFALEILQSFVLFSQKSVERKI